MRPHTEDVSLSQDGKFLSRFNGRWMSLVPFLLVFATAVTAFADETGDNLSVGRQICVNGTNANIGGEFLKVDADAEPLAVLQCVVPKGYSPKNSFLTIATTIQSSCIFSSFATAVKVGNVFAYPDPTGAFFLECIKSEGFEVHSRHWFLSPDQQLDVKAGDSITVFAKSFGGDSFINLRGIVVEVVHNFGILDHLFKK